MDAAIEIGLAVVATTLTICAVFVPVAFMSGIAGEFFGPFSFTVVVAVLCSLLVARTLTPMMAAYFLKPHDRPGAAGAGHDLVPRARALVPRAPLVDARRRDCCDLRDAGPFSAALHGVLAGRRQWLHDAERRACAGRIFQDTLEVAEAARMRLEALPEVGSIYTTVGARWRRRPPDGRRLRGQRAPRLDGHPARQSRRHARSAATIRAQGDEILRYIPGARFQFGSGGGGSRL